MARLLGHLETSGFDGCPRHLGRDEHGRDVLSFILGEVPARWRRFPDMQIRHAAAMLRRFHEATRDLAACLTGGDVICHHDPGPNNTVFRDGRPIAFIDFDLAAPGHPLEDVGYLAWAWCISSRPDRGPVTEQARQVRLLADGYGLGPAGRGRLLAAVMDRLRRNEVFWNQVLENPQASPKARRHAPEVLAWTRREADYVAEHRRAFVATLAE